MPVSRPGGTTVGRYEFHDQIPSGWGEQPLDFYVLALGVFDIPGWRCPAPRVPLRSGPLRWAQCLLLLIPFCAWSQAPAAGPDVIQRLDALEKRLQQSEQELATRNKQLDDALKRIGQLENRLGVCRR